MQKPEQQVGRAIRHISDRLKGFRELVVAPEKIRFVRLIFLDRPAHAVKQELGMWSGVEKATDGQRAPQGGAAAASEDVREQQGKAVQSFADLALRLQGPVAPCSGINPLSHRGRAGGSEER